MLSPLALRPRLQSADFQQALGTRPVARSAHFTVHFAVPSLAPRASRSAGGLGAAPSCAADLCTPSMPERVEPVDQFCTAHRVWRLGLVLPKRLARRSVTRSLIKHQARELWRLHADALEQAGWLHASQPVGNWVLRLKAPWVVKDFASAASEPLKEAVRGELMTMLAHCAKQGVRRVDRSEPQGSVGSPT